MTAPDEPLETELMSQLRARYGIQLDVDLLEQIEITKTAQAFAYWREQSGISEIEAAERLGVGTRELLRVEQLMISRPIREICRWTKELGLPMDGNGFPAAPPERGGLELG